jgi:hypothetical protein
MDSNEPGTLSGSRASGKGIEKFMNAIEIPNAGDRSTVLAATQLLWPTGQRVA